jgi:hypothetical protein
VSRLWVPGFVYTHTQCHTAEMLFQWKFQWIGFEATVVVGRAATRTMSGAYVGAPVASLLYQDPATPRVVIGAGSPPHIVT